MIVALGRVPGDDRLDHRGRGEREDRADAAEQQAAGEHGSDRERRVHVHRVLGDPGPEDVVLELLVQHQEHEHPQRLGGLSLNATITGRTIAMYVPTVGMNCDTMPTQRPSASEYGTPRAKQERPRDDRGHGRLDAA